LSPRLLVSCGEASGDLYAGALTRELHALADDVVVSGLGGPQLAAAGGLLIDDYRDIAVTGLTEAIAKVPRSFAALRRLVASARRERVDAAVMIDFPDFNFRLARRLKRLGIPIIYYVSPQIWAWRSGRIATLRAIVDRVLVIFPFEEQIYREAGVPVEFVGHPLVDLAQASDAREPFLRRHGLSVTAPTVAILPGSRPNELARIFPDLARAAARVKAQVPAAQFVIARAPNLDDRLFAHAQALVPMIVVSGETDNVLAASDVAMVASGTATVQAALHGTPMVIVYRVSRATYFLGRRLVKLDTFGMVNLIAGERIVPELIQDAFTPEGAAAEAVSLLTDRQRIAAMRDGYERMRKRLGGPGASRRAAAAILNISHRRLRSDGVAAHTHGTPR